MSWKSHVLIAMSMTDGIIKHCQAFQTTVRYLYTQSSTIIHLVSMTHDRFGEASSTCEAQLSFAPKPYGEAELLLFQVAHCWIVFLASEVILGYPATDP